MMNTDPIEQQCVNTVRLLAADMVSQANSGHPGMPLGAAPMATVLWKRIMRHNPVDPSWYNRDRFILSAGHGSALLYALLHMSGYDLSLEDLKQFRQMDSKTPGHPEFGHTPGVETTTGPLGQGFAMGVGMALAERRMAQTFNHSDFLPLSDHNIYAIVSDGDLMEGVAAEAASLAGHLCLGKMVYLYDDNRITIEGRTDLTFSEQVRRRFESYEWQVLEVENGEDLDAIEAAILQGKAEEDRPTLIMVRTIIGHGSPKADTSSIHGSPLNDADLDATHDAFNMPKERFHVSAAVRDAFATVIERGKKQAQEWAANLEAFKTRFPETAAQLTRQNAGDPGTDWIKSLNEVVFNAPTATRSASGMVLNAIAGDIPALVGGSADLGPSNNTTLKGDDLADRNIHFGIREHAMSAMCNGMALHGGLIPYCGTFLVFSDYMRGAMRLSALMGSQVVYVLTHDSIAVGEDGPTHQPVEHVATLRAMPNMLVLRPADGYETAAAWKVALSRKQPSSLILSRQKLPTLKPCNEEVAKGGYILSDCRGTPDILLLATGSEVHLAIQTQAVLAEEKIQARVISMPCWELFEEQSQSYKDHVIPPTVSARLGMEAGSSMGWHRWVGLNGALLTVDQFGCSAPGGDILKRYGFSVDNAVTLAKQNISANTTKNAVSAEVPNKKKKKKKKKK
ncbi:MAG: transketolase [Magnetococcales bacterium]|nr:transketolase [Magnetococcales bacterium]